MDFVTVPRTFQLSGTDALAVRASKKLKSDELLLTGFAATRLRMELDRVPLWRGDNVSIRQLVDDFGRYLYLPRLKDSSVLLGAIRDGVAMMTWEQDGFAYADSFDDEKGRYRGLKCMQTLTDLNADSSGLLVKSEVAVTQFNIEVTPKTGESISTPDKNKPDPRPESEPPATIQPKRFHGTVELDSVRIGRDASTIADEVVAHLSGLVGAKVTVTLEIEAEIPSGVSDHTVRTVTENSRALKFTSHGFETE